MKALAASRRHRFAPAVLLLLALLLTGALYAVLAPRPATAAAEDPQDVAAGETLFEANCSTCHGMEAEGTDLAPSLIGVGAASVDFQVSTGRMPMANNSPQAEAKPPVFRDEQISQARRLRRLPRPRARHPHRRAGRPGGRRPGQRHGACSGPTARCATTPSAPAAR